MDLNNYTEVRIVERGGYYLTPMLEHHIDEFLKVISPENQYEILLMGHEDVRSALVEMVENAEVYVFKDINSKIIFAGGLFYGEDAECPQMFAMFSKDIRNNFKLLARASRMIVNFFDRTLPSMSMSVLSDYESMAQWAVWLGFEPVGITEHNENKYIEFVRCNPSKKNVYNSISRPVMH